MQQDATLKGKNNEVGYCQHNKNKGEDGLDM
jgi:hypothetical protein